MSHDPVNSPKQVAYRSIESWAVKRPVDNFQIGGYSTQSDAERTAAALAELTKDQWVVLQVLTREVEYMP